MWYAVIFLSVVVMAEFFVIVMWKVECDDQKQKIAELKEYAKRRMDERDMASEMAQDLRRELDVIKPRHDLFVKPYFDALKNWSA